MRLIDADELYEEHTRLAYEGDYAFHITARAWLEKQPAVDAVQVEWLKKVRKYASEGDSLDVGIAEVLDMWEKEQEVV